MITTRHNAHEVVINNFSENIEQLVGSLNLYIVNYVCLMLLRIYLLFQRGHAQIAVSPQEPIFSTNFLSHSRRHPVLVFLIQ